MKTVQTIKTVLLKSIFMGLLAITAMSCSKDDEEIPEAEEDIALEDISFKIELIKMRLTEDGEANGAIEVFGDISTSLVMGTTDETVILWSRTVDQTVSLDVDESDTPVGGETTFTISSADLEESSVIVEGKLREDDGGVGFTTALGEESSTFSLSLITGTQEYKLIFSDSPNEEVELTYSITRL
ncbi:hypothetical protein [Maribacter sp. IgM3_T14_3]|uniref:hypothetical protein n=1 Tax=Maribacter sp. IgM3_T14_3 TaxID=3415140 RepID=UPI003C6FB172